MAASGFGQLDMNFAVAVAAKIFQAPIFDYRSVPASGVEAGEKTNSAGHDEALVSDLPGTG
jgi:hypothetical protein